MSHPHTPQLADLFEGFSKVYGTYKMDKAPEAGAKRTGRASTVAQEFEVKLWDTHLSGEQGIGIIPVNEEGKVKFAAIDIDSYDLDHRDLIKKIKVAKMPLIPVRSKSGGLHLYCFLMEWTDVKMVQSKLKEMAASLGHGSAEIFPKQTKILISRGDRGSWINMPYFEEEFTTRYMEDDHGDAVDLKGFITAAFEKRITEEDLYAWTPKIVESLPGGPPCLNYLISMGFPAGTRNNGLFNLGVYAMKSWPDEWQKKLEEFNDKFMDPPLSSEEVLAVMKSLKKKEYNYLCKQAPIVSHCDMKKCRGCKFGVGEANSVGMPKFGTLTKILTNPPIWFIDVEDGGRLELTTEELQSPTKFQMRCMEILNVMPTLMKRETWQSVVQELLKDVCLVEIPAETTPKGQLLTLLEEFCTSRVSAKTHEEVLLGKPWLHKGRHWFRYKDFELFLDRNKFKMPTNQITYILKDYGIQKDFWNIKGKGANVISVKEFKAQDQPFTLPPDPETHV